MDGTDTFVGPVNLGNPVEFTILALAEKVIALSGSESRITFEPRPKDDPMQRQPDISLAKERLNWTPATALDDGLQKTIAYFREII
jgi:UDP-glucuronate decarboxylase